MSVGAAAVVGFFLVFGAVTVRQQPPGAESDATGGGAGVGNLEGMLGELDSSDLPVVEEMASAAGSAGSAFELSVRGMNREELRLLDHELHLDLPADFSVIEASMVAGTGGDAHDDDGMDDLTETELREIGDQIGRGLVPVARERRGG